MAIYHLNVSTGSRGGGQSAAAKIAYIEREGKYADGKEEVAHVEHGNMPAFAAENPNEYWTAADRYERANGRLFRQVEFALPIELDSKAQIALAHDFAEKLTSPENLPYTLAIHKGRFDHRGKVSDSPANPHCHLIISERANDGIARSAEQWFKRGNKQRPEQGGAAKTQALESVDWLKATRALWADMANNALERAQSDERIDHRTLAAQGIFDRLPQAHRGVSAHMGKRGEKTDRQRIAAAQAQDRRNFAALAQQATETEAEAKPYRSYLNAAQMLGQALSDKAMLEETLRKTGEREKALTRDLSTWRHNLRDIDGQLRQLAENRLYRWQHPLASRREKKKIEENRRFYAEREERDSTELSGIVERRSDAGMRLKRLESAVGELFLSLKGNGQVIRKNVLESVSEPFRGKVQEHYALWQREIVRDTERRRLNPLEREKLLTALAEQLAANAGKTRSPLEQRQDEGRLITLRGLSAREAGRKLFAETGGDLRYWCLMQASAEAAGFTIRREELEAVQGKHALVVEDALMKAVKAKPRSRERGRGRGIDR